MPSRAQVTSIEALESFRANLVVYRQHATRVLSQMTDEIVRTRLWLQSDRRLHWANEVRRRTNEVEQRQQELFSARLCSFAEATPQQRLAVERARRALAEAEAKLDRVNQWLRRYDSGVAPLGKEIDKLHDLLAQDLVRADHFLSQALAALTAYAGTGSAGQSQPTPPSENSTS